MPTPRLALSLLLAATAAIAQAGPETATVQSVIAKAAARESRVSLDAVCEHGYYRSTTSYGGSGFLPDFAQALSSAVLRNALIDSGATAPASPCREAAADSFIRADFVVDDSGLLMRAP